ncbi:MAG: hypothetical protein RL268_2992 [Pseudomonadota bacterium]
MVLIVGISSGDAGEQVLIAFTGQEVAVVERFLAEVGQQGIAGVIDFDGKAAFVDRLAVVGGLGRGCRQGAGHGLDTQLFHQRFAADIALLGHTQCRGAPRLLACGRSLIGHCLARRGAFCQRCFNFGHARLVSVPEIHVSPPSILSLRGNCPALMFHFRSNRAASADPIRTRRTKREKLIPVSSPVFLSEVLPKPGISPRCAESRAK